MSANDWNLICDLSGFKIKASQSVRQYDGAIVDRRFADRRNPQEFVRGIREDPSVPFARPEGPDVAVGIVTPDDL